MQQRSIRLRTPLDTEVVDPRTTDATTCLMQTWGGVTVVRRTTVATICRTRMLVAAALVAAASVEGFRAATDTRITVTTTTGSSSKTRVALRPVMLTHPASVEAAAGTVVEVVVARVGP